jgi:hypothetical protein
MDLCIFDIFIFISFYSDDHEAMSVLIVPIF